MIKIYLNEKAMSLANNLSLKDFLIEQGHIEQDFSIMLNERFVPRLHYSSVFLRENDVIDMIVPMQGG